MSATWQATENWQLRGWYSYLRLTIDGTGNEAAIEGKAPRNSAFLMSSWELSEQLECDLLARYVDSLPGVQVDHYISMDLRLGWTPRPDLNFQVVGQNLLDSHHAEFREVNAGLPQSSEVRRGVYAQVEWNY